MGYSFHNKYRVGAPWICLKKFLRMHDHKVQWEPKDGYCFLHSLCDVLFDEFGENFDIDTLKALFILEIWTNQQYYCKYYTDHDDNKMVKGVELYLKDGVYAQECVDLIVDAATKLFNVNIGIFQEVNKLIHCINYTAKQPSNRDIFLKYSNEHYKAIVKRVLPKKKNGKSKPRIKDLGADSENESSRDCSTDSSSEEDLAEVQDFRFDLGMEEDESMRKDTGHGEKQMEQNTTNNQKWLPHLNFEQSESDIDDPHFVSTPTSTQDACTDCIDLTSDMSESNTTDMSTSTTLPEYPERQERPPKHRKNIIDE